MVGTGSGYIYIISSEGRVWEGSHRGSSASPFTSELITNYLATKEDNLKGMR